MSNNERISKQGEIQRLQQALRQSRSISFARRGEVQARRSFPRSAQEVIEALRQKKSSSRF